MSARHINVAKNGFTLVELTFAVTFISILLLSILFVTIQAGKLYTKGITYKSVNQVSRELVDVMRRDVAAANASDIEFIVQPANSIKQAGRLCLGQVSYVWNTAALLGDTAAPKVKVSNTANAEAVTFRRVIDPGKTLCTAVSGAYPNTLAGKQSSELLSTNGRDLAIHSLSLKTFDKNGQRGLYDLEAVLGTNETGTVVQDSTSADNSTCKPPSDNQSNFDYCTVIEFEAIMRAGGSL